MRSKRSTVLAAYNAMELMICCAARLLEDGRTAAVGTGVPCAAAMLAQRTGAPHLVVFFEAGGVAPQLPTMPISVGDSRTFYRGLMATSMADVMETLSLHPGVELDQVRKATGFELGVKEPLATTTPPSEQELCILREEVDPHRYVIGRGG